MATLALGVVGAAVGSAFGNPYAGFMIGSTLGSLIDPQAGPHLDANRVSDLRYSGSTYGNAIPRVWGYTRVPGNIIWVAKDSDGNALSEHSSNSGGSKGSPSVTTYSYTASVAVAFCAGTLTMPDGSQVTRNVTLSRLWADDKVIYDAFAVSNPAVSLTFHNGSETQTADSLIASKEGAANTPAYRGTAYVVLTDFLLTDYGNRIPNFSAELNTDAVTVGDVVEDLARQSGLAASDVDVSQATGALTGLALLSRSSGQDAANPLLAAYNLDAAEVDGVLKLVPRGGSPALTIVEADLGANAAKPTAKIEVKRLLESELPGRVDITYFDVDRSLQQATQSAVRQFAHDVQNVAAVTLGLSLTATQARRMAATALDNAWEEVEQQTFSLPQKYLNLAPSDVVVLNFDDNQRRARITSQSLAEGSEIRLETVADDPAALSQTMIGDPGGGITPPGTVAVVPTSFVVWSGTEIRDEDQGKPGFYLAATGGVGWQGCQVWVSPDGGTNWRLAGATANRSVFGSVAGALPDWSAALTFDATDHASVTLVSGQLTTHIPDIWALHSEQNMAVLGSEILSFAYASLTGVLTYDLSRLYRGMRGSSMTGHSAGDLFVLADANVLRIAVDGGYVGQTLQVKALSRYQQLSDVTAKSVTIGARTPTAVEQQVTTLQSTVTTIQTQVTATASDLAAHEAAIASATVLGHVKVGTGLSIDSGGVLSAGGGTWRGAWSGATAYAVNDEASYGGSSYIAIVAGTNHEPDTSPSYWNVVAAKGDTGATGPAGSTGATGPTGAAGTAAAAVVTSLPTAGSGTRGSFYLVDGSAAPNVDLLFVGIEQQDGSYAFLQQPNALQTTPKVVSKATLTLPTISGLQVWFKADVGVTSGVNGVSQWNDQSGNGWNATQSTNANKPTVVANVINGHAVIRFAGGSAQQWLDFHALSLANFTVYAVYKSTAVVAASYILGGTGSGILSGGTSANIGMGAYDGTNVIGATPASDPSSVWNYRTFTNAHLYAGGVEVSYQTGDSGPVGTLNVSRLGDNTTSTLIFTGDIAEVAVYNSQHNATDRSTVELYLRTKYGL